MNRDFNDDEPVSNQPDGVMSRIDTLIGLMVVVPIVFILCPPIGVVMFVLGVLCFIFD